MSEDFNPLMGVLVLLSGVFLVWCVVLMIAGQIRKEACERNNDVYKCVHVAVPYVERDTK